MRAVQAATFGGPEVLELVDVVDPTPLDDQILVEVASAGVNYADTHQTENSYLAPQKLPLVPGAEVVGIARGGRYDGQRVVSLLAGGGGYAELAVAHTGLTFPVPDGVSDGQALSLVLQGTTAWHLLRGSVRLRPGNSIVVHAAAGGVGTMAVQLARQWGAGRVIATASTPDKRQLALDLGAHLAVDVSGATSADEVRRILLDANEGRGVDVVLEMTGGPVFDGSLAAMATGGRLAIFGTASRQAPSPIDPRVLMARSITVAGFWLVHAVRDPGLGPAMEELFSLVRSGRLRPVIGASYPLAQAPQAHADLLARRTTGKLVLTVAG
jgi:NADPH:quinone reductase